MATALSEQEQGQNPASELKLNKVNSIKYLKEMVAKGQEAGHYNLQEGHIIFKALAKLDTVDEDDEVEESEPAPGELDEAGAFEVVLRAVTKSQELGHVYILENASNLFVITVYIVQNVLKKKEKNDAGKGKTANLSKKTSLPIAKKN